jgi:hypothetical protein
MNTDLISDDAYEVLVDLDFTDGDDVESVTVVAIDDESVMVTGDDDVDDDGEFKNQCAEVHEPTIYHGLSDDEKNAEMEDEEMYEANCREIILERSIDTSVSPVQLVSECGIFILKFTADGFNGGDGWYGDYFLESAGEDFDYKSLFEKLKEIRFLVHLYQAIKYGRGNINYKGLYKTFGESGLNNILKVRDKGCVTLFDPKCSEEELPYTYWEYQVNSWLKENQRACVSITVSSNYNYRWQVDASQLFQTEQPHSLRNLQVRQNQLVYCKLW